MQNSNVAARLASLILALTATSALAQVSAHRESSGSTAAINIEKANKRAVPPVEAATKEYEKLLAATPGDAVILNNLGVNYFLMGRVYESQSVLRKAALRSPDSLQIRVNLAIVYNGTFNPGMAIRTLEEVLAQSPGESRARRVLCEIYAQEERRSDAIACYDVLFNSGKIEAAAAANFATSLIDGDQIDRAWEVLRWADLNYPEDAGVKNGLGVVLFRRKKFSTAEAQLQRAVALEPGTAQVRYNLAMAQMASNKRGAVLEQYKYLKTSSPELAGKLYQILFRDKIVSVRPQ